MAVANRYGTRGNSAISAFLNTGGKADNYTIQTILPSDSFEGFAAKIWATQVKSADFDKDGDEDLLVTLADVANSQVGHLLYLENDGTGIFSTTVLATDLNGPAKLEVADMDGDGDMDLVVLAPSRNTVWIFDNQMQMGDAAATFVPNVVDATADAAALGVGVLRANGLPDIVIGRRNLVYYANRGELNFDDGVELWNEDNENFVCISSCSMNTIRVADADGDGLTDILFTTVGIGDLLALYQRSESQFEKRIAVVVEAEAPRSFQVADLNKDGLMDTIVHSGNDRKVYFCLAQEKSAPAASPMPSTGEDVSMPTPTLTPSSGVDVWTTCMPAAAIMVFLAYLCVL